MLDRGAAEIVDGSSPDDSASNAGTPAASVSVGNDVADSGDGLGDEMIGGVRDLMLAKLQIGGAAALLHAYAGNRNDLFEMLRPN